MNAENLPVVMGHGPDDPLKHPSRITLVSDLIAVDAPEIHQKVACYLY